ncbi:NAD(P)-dependent oxidoreductase [Leptolyngbyaceae cyanobacterium CCMR0082]|uniref:NAD(P)-dependent oxidoreductase n=2 Tax=Adonisia turfae TaxID=2950184 RepID=A0A6M0S1S9_9CYAN|nr:NAD(P)-dependent oxidoreductase [Adonisia turfae]NEZ58900.1 NAD(P)-dependent oxidoreductase [Adonisia turfae CCMR0081]NEZ61882.1 NAD(P)-dependent oxidoreductase [Adonisia turfae CCMR0082]
MNIGFLGTGLMGTPMAQLLQSAGYQVYAWNRSAHKLEGLLATGVKQAETPASAIAASQLIILMLTNAAAIETTLLSPEAKAELTGKTVLQMGTIAPQESKAIAQAVQAAGGDYFEAPVLGSIPEAKAGTLIVMVGATPEQFAQWRPILACFGPEPQLMGPVGAGSGVKLAMNQLIGTLTTAFSMSLGLVQQESIDVEKFMAIVRQSALYAPTFDKKLGRMCDRNFANPNFPSKHLLKDMNLFVQAADTFNADVAKSVAHMVQQAVDKGLADQDYSAVFAAVNE